MLGFDRLVVRLLLVCCVGGGLSLLGFGSLLWICIAVCDFMVGGWYGVCPWVGGLFVYYFGF